MLKTAPAYRQAGICGVALILALLDEQIDLGERSAFKWVQERSGFYLTGQVVASYTEVRLTPPVVGSYRQDFERLASEHF